MALPTEIENQLIQFLKPKIVFNTIHNQFVFNGKWLIDISEDDFMESALEILLKINNHLQVGINNKEFLNGLVTLIDDKLSWFEHKKINNIRNIAEFVKTITSSSTEIQAPKSERYSIEYLLSNDEEIENILLLEDGYYYYLRLNAGYFNNYSESISVENVKLHYILIEHYQWVLKMVCYLDSLLLNFESINFSEYQFEYQLAKNGFKELMNSSPVRQSCHLNLTKKESAALFITLLAEGIIEFDKNPKKNKVAMEKFVENNFTYKGENDKRCVIKNMKQEYSDLTFPNEKLQIPLIEKLIEILEVRKSRI